MLKRRDWLNLKGPDGCGGGSDSSSDDSDDDDERAAPPADEEQDDEETSTSGVDSGSEDSDGEGPAPGPRAGKAESDEEAEPELSAADVIRVWSSEDPEVNKFKGIPLRCVPCNMLLLSRISYIQHVASKKHQKKVKAAGPGAAESMIQVSSTATAAPEEEEETHMERLERLKRLAAEANASVRSKEASVSAKAEAAASGGRSKRPTARAAGRASKGATPLGIPVVRGGDVKVVRDRDRKRPGKRQRAEQRSHAAAVAEGRAEAVALEGMGPGMRQLAAFKLKAPLKRAGKRQRSALKAVE